MKQYDLVVIGGGPSGEKAAARAAYFGKKVAIINQHPQPGGAGVHTGTIPSKTLKESALFFSGKYDAGLYGVDKNLDSQVTIKDFFFHKRNVIESEVKQIQKNLAQHEIDYFNGRGSFIDAHTIHIDGTKEEDIHGKFILIATGSYPFHPSNIPFDFERVHDSDSILNLKRLPKSLLVIGAGVIGCEYATIFANMGTQVFLIDGRDTILPFIDDEITDELVNLMKDDGVEILFNTSVEEVEVPEKISEPIRTYLKTGEVLPVDMILFAAGRSGNTKHLHCENAGVEIGKREVVVVDENYQTAQPHIFAAGDVIGFPALASTSMDQGRVAVSNMFPDGIQYELAKIFPYGIYTIPEVSMVGITEEEAIEKKLNYEVGRAWYRDMPRGKIMGEKNGFIKIIFDRDNYTILGIHIIGILAAELIHYGLTLVQEKRTLEELVSVVFNFPTLHDLYKYAAYDGLGNVYGKKVKN